MHNRITLAEVLKKRGNLPPAVGSDSRTVGPGAG